jgi:dihydrofolate synthase/folylpolyglutamate synthase
MPKLFGRHQIENAATAIAALRQSDWVSDAAVEKGLRTVEWPARMQRLTHGPLVEFAPQGAEVWLDGGHNPHGGAAVARALADLEDRADKPLYLISGMLANKDATGYFANFRGLVRHVVTIAIPGEPGSLGAGALYDRVRAAGLEASPAEDVEDAMLQVAAMSRMDEEEAARILICGSLYLAGHVLAENG